MRVVSTVACTLVGWQWHWSDFAHLGSNYDGGERIATIVQLTLAAYGKFRFDDSELDVGSKIRVKLCPQRLFCPVHRQVNHTLWRLSRVLRNKLAHMDFWEQCHPLCGLQTNRVHHH